MTKHQTLLCVIICIPVPPAFDSLQKNRVPIYLILMTLGIFSTPETWNYLVPDLLAERIPGP